MGLTLIMVHVVISIISYILIRLRVLKVDRLMMIMIVCIPIWGFFSAVIVSIMVYTGRVGISGKDLEAMKSSNQTTQTLVVETPEGENVVPLEDALLMDDSATKRSLMLDVLMTDTGDYLSVINEARMNSDVEVVHYATTAMVELSKEYELKLQKYSSEYAANPLKEGLLDEYISFLEQYVSSGMIQGQLLEIQKNTLQQLLMEKVNRKNNPSAYESLINALFASGQLSIADSAISQMEKEFPGDERCFKLRFRYYYEVGAGNKLREMIASVKNSGEFYSKEIREMVDFWDDAGKETIYES